MQRGALHQDFEGGPDIWFRFVSDDSVFYKGFNLSYIVISETRKLIPFLSLFLVINNPENFKLQYIQKARSKKGKYCLIISFFHLMKFNHRPDSGSSKYTQKLHDAHYIVKLLYTTTT